MTTDIQWTPPDLLTFIGKEETNLLVSLARMDDLLVGIKQIENLYATATSDKSAKEDDMVIFHLLSFTHFQFLYSMTCQMRCHLSEAFGAARAAIDAALIAAYIIRDRAAQVAYVKREKPFDNFARHLGHLRRDGKLPHPLMSVLLDQHKKISGFAVHADIGSFVHRTQRSEENGQAVMSYQFFQITKSEDETRIHTLNLLHTFVMVLDLFADFLVNEQKAVAPEWTEQLHGLGRQIERRVEVLRERVRKDAGVDVQAVEARPATASKESSGNDDRR